MLQPLLNAGEGLGQVSGERQRQLRPTPCPHPRPAHTPRPAPKLTPKYLFLKVRGAGLETLKAWLNHGRGHREESISVCICMYIVCVYV